VTAGIFVPLDLQDIAKAQALVEALAPHVAGFKIGKEFFTRFGPEGVRQAVGDAPLFLDLKYHDIPNQVAGAVSAAVASLAPDFLTLHASGGPAMLRAAAEARPAAARTKLLAVTVMTSLSEEDLAAVGQRGPMEEQVLRLGRLAVENGIHGLVCSPLEIAAVRRDLPAETVLMVPGVRPTWAASGDQKRVMTPADAQAAGADYLVIGRPITGADDPVAAAQRIGEELATGG